MTNPNEKDGGPGGVPVEDQERVVPKEVNGAIEEPKKGPTDEELLQALRDALRRVEGR